MLGFVFVDDTDLVILGDKLESADMVILRLQQAIIFWNGILRVSGGSLKPEKCYWYLTRYTWTAGVCTLDASTPPDVTISTDGGCPHPIKYIPPNEATKAVGV